MVLSIEEIKERLPHRYPFLLVDRIVDQSPGRCVGVKNVTCNEPFFQGHFPGQSIVPGMIIAEAMAQTAAFTQDTGEKSASMKGFLTAMNIKFHRPVVPGDRMIIEVRMVKAFSGLTKFVGDVRVDGSTVASGDFVVAIIREPEQTAQVTQINQKGAGQ
ncbi:MAG: 3-hydroxyacyl-(acyl-carrier-protein) dehydratase FabZ [Syntrophorhabdus sp. PtaB.Bin184]|nr:MAG: 3-hydroxyacyl-(acyl-carrier-protein) dehydratase FabZ [Syntrophorhabdus sp. PtaB.Bin184]